MPFHTAPGLASKNKFIFQDENAEPAEPQIQYLTLEEYEAAQAGDAAADTKKEVRQSNDGQALKGRHLESKKVYNTIKSTSKTVVRETNKQHVSNEFIGFQSDYGSGRDRRDNRGGNRRDNNRGDRNNNNDRRGKAKAGSMANIDDQNAFPALGAK